MKSLIQILNEQDHQFITCYHGTDVDGAIKISKEKRILGFYGWGVGISTTINRALNYGLMAVQRYSARHKVKFSPELLKEKVRVVVLQLNADVLKHAEREMNAGVNDAFLLRKENQLLPLKILNLNDKNIVKNWKIINFDKADRKSQINFKLKYK